ncbi:MAG: O-antigen ligase family protein [Parachlamydiaceae bacterium]|nr:O-antigen ligase family protein [Parachlamydiaceae bacterium]
MPKINFWHFEGQTAGVRIDDLLLLIFGTIFLWGYFLLQRKVLDIEKAVFAIAVFSCFSYIMNRLLVASGYLHVNASIFYSVRLLEYFLFFYVGVLASRFISLGSLLRALIVWNLLFMLLQEFQIIGVFTMEGYLPYAEDNRLLGIASFGAEMGLLLNLLFCFFIYEEPSRKSSIQLLPKEFLRFFRANKAFFLLLLFVGLVILTGARIAILALLFTFLLRLKDLVRWRSLSTFFMPLLTLGLAVSLMSYMLYNVSGIVSRSEGLLSLSNLELIPIVWDNIVLDYDPIGKETVSYDGYDASWWMRIHKWCYALKIYWNHPAAWLQGVGPGFAMPALDGGIIRIITELGIIGFSLYFWLFYLIARVSRPLKWMVIAMALNMLFFDVYLAYKPMSLLFLIVGYTYNTSTRTNKDSTHNALTANSTHNERTRTN